jgi:transcriptional regulator with XRE-family HTH domain
MAELTKAGVRLHAWLKANGKSQRWLAKKLGVGADALWRWCVGERQPRIDHCAAIQRITGIGATEWANDATASATPPEAA